MLTPPAFEALWRPLNPEEKNTLSGCPNVNAQDLLDELEMLIQKGNEAEKVAAADLAGILLHKMLMENMLDSKHGAIPEFTRQIEKSVEFYDNQLS